MDVVFWSKKWSQRGKWHCVQYHRDPLGAIHSHSFSKMKNSKTKNSQVITVSRAKFYHPTTWPGGPSEAISIINWILTFKKRCVYQFVWHVLIPVQFSGLHRLTSDVIPLYFLLQLCSPIKYGYTWLSKTQDADVLSKLIWDIKEDRCFD